jgi:signal transduction histidine kinase/streptogramin lyase/ActR/RegA family two-component response regulator
MKFLLLFLTLLFSTQSWSQDYLPMEHIDEVDGLSFRIVKQVYQDREGFLWFCTGNGLNRYDGVEWKNYKHIKGDSTSIPTNVTNWVFEDADGNLIIDNSDDEPVYSFYNRKTEEFRRIKVLNYRWENELVIRGPFTTKSGKIIGVGKLVRLNKYYNHPEKEPEAHLLNYLGDGVFEVSHEITFSVANAPDSEMLTSTSERYWSAGFSKHELLDLEKRSLTRYLSEDFGSYELPIDDNGNFWYPDMMEGSERLFGSFQLPAHIPLEDWEVYCFDNYGNVWLKEKNNRVFKYDIHLKTLNENGEFDMNYFSLSSILQDSDGTLWVPGRFGINKLRKKSKYFQHFLKGTFAFDNLSSGQKKKQTVKGVIPYPIIEATDRKVITLAKRSHLYTIDPSLDINMPEAEIISEENGIVKHYFPGSSVDMLPASNGQVWLGNGLINRYDPVSKKTINYLLPDDFPKFKSLVIGEKMRSIQFDEAGKIWFVALNDRLFAFDTLSKKYTIFPEKKFPKGIVGIEGGQMWIVTDTFLYQFDKNNKIEKFFNLPHESITKNNYEIFNIVPYKDKVWIGTQQGLLAFDPIREQFKLYTTRDGLPHNMIYTIIPYGENLWMGTHYGLSRFNILTKEVKNFYVTDGLTHNEFNRKSALKTKDGKLYFGGMNGINAFYPNVLDSLTRLERSTLAWTGFSKLDAKEDTITNYKAALLDENKPIEIYYGDKSYSFRFALLNFINPSKNTYSYYLDGYEKDWNYAGNTPFANYPSLPSGNYILRVKAKDVRGNSGRNELSIPIIVYKPWWSSWWARGLFVFSLLGSMFTYYQWRTLSLKRQKRKLEQTVKERTIELEKQKERAEQSEKYKEQFLANMSHEIRTPMHAISGMVKILNRNEHPPSQDIFLNAMHASADNLVVILNDVLDLSKIEAGKLDIENIPISPISVMENVHQILKYKAEEKGLKFNYQVHEELPPLIMGDPTRLNQILINLAGNAIKFTEKGSVDIFLKKENDRLKFSIKDTGIGIPKEKVEKIFGAFEQAKDSTSRYYGGTGLGLSISKQLVELQQGEIWAESEEGKGSTFFVELPLVAAAADATSQDLITAERLKMMTDSLQGIRILLAEDNAFNQMIAQDDLSFYIKNAKIDIVENGALAVEKFKTDNYDLILMDVQMPEMNGFEATRKIRVLEKGKNTRIPIIAMTASLLKSEIESCRQAGMDNYIPKPYQSEELIGPIFSEMNKN